MIPFLKKKITLTLSYSYHLNDKTNIIFLLQKNPTFITKACLETKMS